MSDQIVRVRDTRAYGKSGNPSANSKVIRQLPPVRLAQIPPSCPKCSAGIGTRHGRIHGGNAFEIYCMMCGWTSLVTGSQGVRVSERPLSTEHRSHRWDMSEAQRPDRMEY